MGIVVGLVVGVVVVVNEDRGDTTVSGLELVLCGSTGTGVELTDNEETVADDDDDDDVDGDGNKDERIHRLLNPAYKGIGFIHKPSSTLNSTVS